MKQLDMTQTTDNKGDIITLMSFIEFTLYDCEEGSSVNERQIVVKHQYITVKVFHCLVPVETGPQIPIM